MSHKAGVEFFQSKRPWSRVKDSVLTSYLNAYIPKVWQSLRKPIVIVDGFSGPGRFDDGEPGSPLLISASIQKSVVPVNEMRLICIEKNDECFGRLKANLAPFPFAEAHNAEFEDLVDTLSQIAAQNTLFVYLDPFTAKGLRWDNISRVLDQLRHSSIEMLLNFNAPAFVRSGLRELSIGRASSRAILEGDVDMAGFYDLSVASLNEIVGGAWWQELLRANSGFDAQVHQVVARLVQQLGERFSEKGHLMIKAHEHDRVPKYALIFGSRSSIAIMLMNDVMVGERNAASLYYEDLFSKPELRQFILDGATAPVSRGSLKLSIVREAFGQFTTSEIGLEVSEMIKLGLLESDSGKSRINDQAKVWSTGMQFLPM